MPATICAPGGTRAISLGSLDGSLDAAQLTGTTKSNTSAFRQSLLTRNRCMRPPLFICCLRQTRVGTLRHWEAVHRFDRFTVMDSCQVEILSGSCSRESSVSNV